MRLSPAPEGADTMRPISDSDLVLPNQPAARVEEAHNAAQACPACDGAGWYTRSVPFGHPDFAKLVPCRCTAAAREQRRMEELARLSNLAAFRDQTFANFDALAPGVQLAYQRAVTFVRRPSGWLTLLGPYGCGKTHLAAAIANVVLDHQVPVLFVVVPDLLDHLRSTFRPDSDASYDARFELVRTVPLLVLDDLGTESGTGWAREKLYQIVNHRYNERLPTVFTSNIRLEALDGRIVSRMHDAGIGAVVVQIAGQDYRRRPTSAAPSKNGATP